MSTRLSTNFDDIIKQFEYMQDANRRKVVVGMAIKGKSLMLPRVKQGKASDNSKFSPYSNTPAYFSRNGTQRGKTTPPYGKPYGTPPRARQRFESGKKAGNLHNSKYYKYGYREFRKRSGRRLSSNRLVWSNKMLGNMRIDPLGKSGAIIHFPRPEENVKALGNQDRYNFAWFTPQEIKRMMDEGFAIEGMILENIIKR